MRAAIVALLLLALASCGQKGPLYFAEPETTPAADAAAVRAPTSEQDNEEEAGEPTP